MSAKCIKFEKVKRLFIVLFLTGLFFYQPSAFSQTGTKALLNPEKSAVEKKKAGHDVFNLSVELLTSVHGEQTFDVIDSDENLISRLKFPHRGQAMVFKGEVFLLPWLSMGGRYSSSSVLQLSNANSTDTDWRVATGDAVWKETYDSTKTEVTFFDANIYARLIDLEKDKNTNIVNQALDFLLIGKNSKLFLDLFGGYQYQKGRYGMFDMTEAIDNYVSDDDKINSHDSFYKSVYRGPRLGVRGEYSYNRFSTRISFAYAWLKTRSDAYWNLRDYFFYQYSNGYDGYGINLEGEIRYQFTKHISGGFGYNFMMLCQHKMKESGIDKTGNGAYADSDIIRNANSVLYGPSVFVRVNW